MDGASLVTELKNASQDILATGESFILDETPGVFQLCFVLEKILNHGLKDLAFIGKTSFWEFLEHLDQCMPGTSDVLNNVRECSKTPLGRGRVFIRVTLNEGAATDYFKALVWNRDLSRKYYKDNSLLRHDQLFALVLNHLDALSTVKFSLVVKDTGFDDPAYYDKMALELVMAQRSQGSLTNMIANANQEAASKVAAATPQSNYVSAVANPLPQKTQPQEPPKPAPISTPAPSTPSVAPTPIPTHAAVPTPTKTFTPINPDQPPDLEIKTHTKGKKKTVTRNKKSTKIEGPGESTTPKTDTAIETTEDKHEVIQKRTEPELVTPPTHATIAPEPITTPEPIIEPTIEPTPEIIQPHPEPIIEPTIAPTPEPVTEPQTATIPYLTVSVPSEPSHQPPISSPASSISDSDLVSVKMSFQKSPASTSTDTESSLFSSAEIMSSQTSTPSFTTITDDTDISPLTTPNLQSDSINSSPFLNVDSANTSANNISIPSLEIDGNDNSEPTLNYDASSPPGIPFAQASPPTERIETIDKEETDKVKEEKEEPINVLEKKETIQEPVVEAPQQMFTQKESEVQKEESIALVAEEQKTEEKKPEEEKKEEKEEKVDENKEEKEAEKIETANEEMGLPIDQPVINPYTPTVLPPLVEDLKREVYAVLEQDTLIQKADSLLSTIEKILCHRIRAGTMFSHCPLPIDQVWAFVKNLPSYLSETEAVFDEIRANREIETDMGRARSWMRVALNHSSLANHLKSLLGDHKRVIEYYEETALLRSYEHLAMILVLIDSLSSGRFCLQTHDEYIDIHDKKFMEKKTFAVPQEKSKKRIASQRRKKASIETLADGSTTETTSDPSLATSSELEVNVVTRTRRSSSASRTKRPTSVEITNYQNSDSTPETSPYLSATPAPTLLGPSTSPSSSSFISPPTIDLRSSASLSSSKVEEESTPVPKTESTSSNLDYELPPMPQIPTGGFMPISTDVIEQIEQIQQTQPSTPPSSSSAFSLSSTSEIPPPSSDIPPPSSDTTNEPEPSINDFPRSIPFGVPDYNSPNTFKQNNNNNNNNNNNFMSDYSYQTNTSTTNTNDYSIPINRSFSSSSLYNESGVSTPERNTPPSPQPFFHKPLSLSMSFTPNSSLGNSLDSYGSTPTYSYSSSANDDSKVTVSEDFLRAHLSEDYDPTKRSKAVDFGSRRGSLNGAGSLDSDDGGSSFGSMKYGSTPVDSDPSNPNLNSNSATASNSNPPVTTHYLLDVNRKVQRNNMCPGCGTAISQGLFSTARLCAYYNAYYCKECHVGDEAVIPARLVHQLDPKTYPVCSEARGHIHQYYRHPQLNMRVLNPSAYKYSASLEKAGKLRRQLKYLGDYVKTCRNKESLLNLMDGRQYMLDSLDIYSLRDLIDAISGTLLPFLYAILEKFISHVTKSCATCKGKGFYCEYCNSGELIFSWMVLKASECMQCPGCRTLVHTKCYKKGNGQSCPKCKRIAALKAKSAASHS